MKEKIEVKKEEMERKRLKQRVGSKREKGEDRKERSKNKGKIKRNERTMGGSKERTNTGRIIVNRVSIRHMTY